MQANGKTVKEILTNLPADRAEPFKTLHDVIVKNLPKGFEAAISMVDWDMLFPIQFILQVIIANQASHYHLRDLLHRKILLIFTIWVFMLTPNYWNGL